MDYSMELVLKEFLSAIKQESGCDVSLVRRGDTFWVEARVTLEAIRPIKGPENVALRHVPDPAAYLHDLVESQLRPMTKTFRRARDQSALAWRTICDGEA